MLRQCSIAEDGTPVLQEGETILLEQKGVETFANGPPFDSSVFRRVDALFSNSFATNAM